MSEHVSYRKGAIIWGEGGFVQDNWACVYGLIKRHDIKSVLEYGCGLSTELLLAVGMDVVSLETQKDYAISVPGSHVLVCDYNALPKMDRSFDMALIDGPGAREFEVKNIKPERKLSALHAARYATKLIYIHDGGLGQEAIDAMPEWRRVKNENIVGYHDIVYERIN